MVERDEIERLDYQPVVPADLDDPPQFGQLIETVKDAFVLAVRSFFDQPALTTTEAVRREQIPTVRKYGVGYAPGTDPYATTQQILQDFADKKERLPHIAVTAVQGTNNRGTIGPPFIAHVQNPPRVTANPEPYALGASAAESWRITATTITVGQVVSVELNGGDFAYTVQAGDTRIAVAAGLRDALRAAEPFFLTAPDPTNAAALLVTNGIVNEAFTPDVTAGLTAAQVQAAGTALSDQIVVQTTPIPSRQEVPLRAPTPVIEVIVLRPDRFPDSAPATAAAAVDVARVINEQARACYAEVAPEGDTFRIKPRGPTPNEVAILSDTSANAQAVFGFGTTGGAGTVTLTTNGAPGVFTLTATGVGTALAAATASGVQAYVELPDGPHPGRFAATFISADVVTFLDPNETQSGATGAVTAWFVGKRDDWQNPARPVCNRKHMSAKTTVSLSALAESPNEATELQDLIQTQFSFYLAQQFYTLLGRGILDADNYPDELYQISIGQDITPSAQSRGPRPNDAKDGVYEARVSVAATIWSYQDSAVTVPSGPDAGKPWVLTADKIVPRP